MEPKNGTGDGQTREDAKPRLNRKIDYPLGQQGPPAHRRGLDPKPEEAEARLREDIGGDAEAHGHEDHGQTVWKEVSEDNPPLPCAQRGYRSDILRFPKAQHLPPHDSGHRGPSDRREHDDHAEQAGPFEDGGQRDSQDESGKGHYCVGNPH